MDQAERRPAHHQVRDLAIQKQMDDLVIGTFGRSIYVLDDYSPLARRHAAR